MLNRLFKTKTKRLEVKAFTETDTCEYCISPHWGYIDDDLDRYINVREGHLCAICGVSEKPI